MNIQQIEYLIALRKHRHFVKAAEACGVTQPTLSAMIARLEEELSVKLVDRSSQPIQLTAVGERIADQGASVLQGVQGISDIASEEQGSLKGVVRIGILPTIAPFLLPRLIPASEKAVQEGLEWQWIELNTEQCQDNLREGSIDLALMAGDLSDPKLTTHTLYYEEFVGYVARNEALWEQQVLKSSDLVGQRLWLLNEGHCFRQQLVRFCSLNQANKSRSSYQLGGIETYMHLVEAGHGITFVPALAIETMTDKQRALLRRFAIPRPVRPIMLCHTPHYMRMSVINYLAGLIRSCVPPEMLTLAKDQTLATKIK